MNLIKETVDVKYLENKLGALNYLYM